MSQYSLRSTNSENKNNEPQSVVAHNALRSAALSLGFTPDEVNENIGYEKNNIDKVEVQKWSDSLPSGGQNTMNSVAQWANSTNTEYFSDDLITEHLHQQSRALTESWIKNSILELTLQQSELPESVTRKNVDGQNENDEELKVIAQDLVANVISKASERLKTEEEKAARCEEKRLECLALKLSMLVIGSVGKACGHNDVDIIRGLDRDRHERYRKEKLEREQKQAVSEKVEPRRTRRPSVLKSSSYIAQRRGSLTNKTIPIINTRRLSLPSNVKFNESSIDEARRDSLALPQGRRHSLRDRPLTPKPRDSLIDVDSFPETSASEHSVHFEENILEVDANAKQRKR